MVTRGKKNQELGDVSVVIQVCLQNNLILLGEDAVFLSETSNDTVGKLKKCTVEILDALAYLKIANLEMWFTLAWGILLMFTGN